MLKRIATIIIISILAVGLFAGCRKVENPAPDNNIEQPQDDIDDDATATEVEATGIYNGGIDSNSVEIEVNGEALAFRLSEQLKEELEGRLPTSNTVVNLTYFKNEHNQLILTALDWDEERVTGTFVGFIDSNSVEIEVNGEPKAFRLSESAAIFFEKNDIREGDSLSFTFEENEYNQLIILEIEKI